MYQPGGWSPSPDVVMCGKSGGTQRIQYSSAAPPPVGVIVMTIASLASIVTVVSSRIVPPTPPIVTVVRGMPRTCTVMWLAVMLGQ